MDHLNGPPDLEIWAHLPEFLANLLKIPEMVTPTGIEPVFQP
jgi:hypothetical protein